jgi:capsular polysaccharide biosynthesis protein
VFGLVGAVLAALLALWVSARMAERYSAESQVVLGSPGQVTIFGSGGSVNPSALALAAAQSLRSPEVRERASELLGGTPSPETIADSVIVTANEGSPVVSVLAEGPTARAAKSLADAMGQAYLDLRAQRYQEQAETATETLTALRDEQQARLTEIQQRINVIVAEVTEQAVVLALPSDRAALVQATLAGHAEYQALQEQATSLSASLRDVNDRIQQAQVDYSLLADGVDELDEASLPKDPTSPTTERNVAVAAVLGALLGLALAWRLTDRARVLPPQSAAQTLGAPVLGRISSDRKLRRVGRFLDLEAGSATASELRAVASAVLLNAERHGRRALVITSAHRAEGKTVLAANVAAAGEFEGHPVMLVDAADGALTAGLGMALDPDAEVRPDEAILAPELIRHNGERRLAVVPHGPRPVNDDMLSRLSTPDGDIWVSVPHGDSLHNPVAIVDAPAINADPLPLQLARSGALIVVASPRTELADLEMIRNRAELAGIPIIGLVLNEHRAQPSRNGAAPRSAPPRSNAILSPPVATKALEQRPASTKS